MTLRLASLLALLLGGCATSTSSLAERCTIGIDAVEPDAGFPGDRVVLRGGPLTTHFDTAIYLDGTRATVLDLSRDGCDACDTCRSEAGCNACGDCDACDAECRENCVETVTFSVPDLPPGAVGVRIYNSHGTGGPFPFTVEGSGVDTGDTAGETGDTAGETGDTAGETGETGDTGPADTAGPPGR